MIVLLGALVCVFAAGLMYALAADRYGLSILFAALTIAAALVALGVVL